MQSGRRCAKVHESARECANTFWRITNVDAGSICWNPVALAEKTWLMVNARMLSTEQTKERTPWALSIVRLSE